MTWNYRIILHPATKSSDQGWYGLHEVFYEGDEPITWTSEPVTFISDEDEGQRGIWDGLAIALADAVRLPVLTERDGKLECS